MNSFECCLYEATERFCPVWRRLFKHSVHCFSIGLITWLSVESSSKIAIGLLEVIDPCKLCSIKACLIMYLMLDAPLELGMFMLYLSHFFCASVLFSMSFCNVDHWLVFADWSRHVCFGLPGSTVARELGLKIVKLSFQTIFTQSVFLVYLI